MRLSFTEFYRVFLFIFGFRCRRPQQLGSVAGGAASAHAVGAARRRLARRAGADAGAGVARRRPGQRRGVVPQGEPSGWVLRVGAFNCMLMAGAGQ